MCRGTSKAVKILLDMSFIKLIYINIKKVLSNALGAFPSVFGAGVTLVAKVMISCKIRPKIIV